MQYTDNNSPYRTGVGIMLLNQEGLVFVGRRINVTPEAWQMPQGGIDPGESPLDAAKRELYEETGVKDDIKVIATSHTWYTYNIPHNISIKLNNQYRGQKQKWFLMALTTKDTIIHIDMPNPEFSDWKWVTIHELPNLIVSFKRPLYVEIVKEFTPFIASPSTILSSL